MAITDTEIWKSVETIWPTKGSAAGPVPKRDYEDLSKVNAALLSLLGFGALSLIIVGFRATSPGGVLMWAVACLAVGGTVGFLFGIPRSGGQNARSGSDRANGKSAPLSPDFDGGTGRPNTNLEEVSDWLTKIIVGLSLVHLKTIEERVIAISRNAAASLNPASTAADVSMATALVVGFTVIGFLCGYLYTRLFLQGAFVRSDRGMLEFQKVVAVELARPTTDATPADGEPSVPSTSDRQSAERVLKVAAEGRPDEVLIPLRKLAAEYEKTRSELPFGNARTRKMSEISSRMKRLALAAAPFLEQLSRSLSPGERLAAVIILQMKFDPDYIEWLASRIVEEPAFCGYQAASALLARIRTDGDAEGVRIKAAAQDAMQKRTARGLEPEEKRDKLVEQILAR
jgi:hypothetical protein